MAPTFWIAALGLPGGALYKAANTADFMIGHRSERYESFGWAAARFDDLVNLPASRLAALWLVLAAAFTPRAEWRAGGRGGAARRRKPSLAQRRMARGGAGRRAWASSWRGRASMAARRVDDVFMGDGRAELDAADIRRALALYRRACAAQMLALLRGACWSSR